MYRKAAQKREHELGDENSWRRGTVEHERSPLTQSSTAALADMGSHVSLRAYLPPSALPGYLLTFSITHALAQVTPQSP